MPSTPRAVLPHASEGPRQWEARTLGRPMGPGQRKMRRMEPSAFRHRMYQVESLAPLLPVG